MKIVIAPDSFKGSMTASIAAEAMERGINRVDKSCQIIKIPLADGGEGTVDTLLSTLGGKRQTCSITGPLGNKIDGSYGIVGQTAIMEVAAAVGYHLVPDNKMDPMYATSFGFGELILHALDKGIRKFIIGLGGSVTNDGGIGMMQALGAEILNSKGEEVSRGGRGLLEINRISKEELDVRLKSCEFLIAADVENKLIGKEGATYVYGSQKGATEGDLTLLEAGMKQYANVLVANLGKDMANTKGAGAAGGLGIAFLAFLGAKLSRGIDLVMEMTQFESHLENTDLIITGEGKIDSQTMYGKVLKGVTELAKTYQVPILAIAGLVDEDIAHKKTDFAAIYSLTDKIVSKQEAMKNASLLTEEKTEIAFRDFLRNKKQAE